MSTGPWAPRPGARRCSFRLEQADWLPMLEALKLLLSGRATGAGVLQDASRRLQIAACALLVELAYADQEFSAEERRHIEELAMRHFDLDAEAARELMAVAEE